MGLEKQAVASERTDASMLAHYGFTNAGQPTEAALVNRYRFTRASFRSHQSRGSFWELDSAASAFAEREEHDARRARSFCMSRFYSRGSWEYWRDFERIEGRYTHGVEPPLSLDYAYVLADTEYARVNAAEGRTLPQAHCYMCHI